MLKRYRGFQWGGFNLHYTFGCACRNDGDLELLDPELHSPEMLKCVWEDAITDIVVVRSVPMLPQRLHAGPTFQHLLFKSSVLP